MATTPDHLTETDDATSGDDAGPLVGGRVAFGTTGDDTGREGVPRSARWSTVARLALLAACVVAVYGRDLASLPAALSVDSPLAYAALAPIVAFALAVLGIREAPRASAVVPVRAGDHVCGATMLGLALLIGWGGPNLFGFAATPWRVAMASLPFFLAGSVWLLFGGRATWWLRHSFLFAALAAPVWYVWAVTPLLTFTTELTWMLVAPLANVFGARTVDASGTGFVAIGDQLAAVSAVCSGASSMVAWVIVGGALSTRMVGPSRRKWRWLLSGIGLAWLVNVVRILIVVLVGRYISAGAALGWIHPYAGIVSITVVCALMLHSTTRLGLSPAPGEGAPVVDRLAAVAPVAWRKAGLAMAGTATVLVVIAATGGWRLDPLGGRNGQVNGAVGLQLTRTRTVAVAGQPWTVSSFGDVPWASQYFGGGSVWRRFSLFAPTTGPQATWTVAVDTTEVNSAANLDAFTLEACYGFHGYQLERSEVTDLLVERPAERIDYLDEGTGIRTMVVSWRQRVADGRLERVVASVQAHTGIVTETSAGLPDAATAERAVQRVAGSLAGLAS